MYIGEDIKQQREARANNIVKGFSNSDNLLEKAHNHGEVHSNGKWYWESSANGGKGDWRTIKTQSAENKEEPKKKISKKVSKLTPVQQKVMDRFENGQKLAILETNRMSGDAMFWCEKDEKSGLWRAKEKALYPQLRRLFWDKMITKDMRVDASQIDKEYNQYELHASGAIGF